MQIWSPPHNFFTSTDVHVGSALNLSFSGTLKLHQFGECAWRHCGGMSHLSRSKVSHSSPGKPRSRQVWVSGARAFHPAHLPVWQRAGREQRLCWGTHPPLCGCLCWAGAEGLGCSQSGWLSTHTFTGRGCCEQDHCPAHPWLPMPQASGRAGSTVTQCSYKSPLHSD